jgi:hypothetical protein
MREKSRHEAVESSEVCYDTLEQWARGQIQDQLQRILEEEVTTFLGRQRHERRERVSPLDPPKGSRCQGSPKCPQLWSSKIPHPVRLLLRLLRLAPIPL